MPGERAELTTTYSLPRRLGLAVVAMAAAVVIAGFWNYRLVDGFGRDLVAGRTLGDTAELAGAFGDHGFGFGFLFAAVAGLAATFTACNCVVFAMLPGLACSGGGDGGRRRVLGALGAFTTGVVVVGAVYGAFIGSLGPEGIEAFNSRAVRSAQARIVFTTIGLILIVWGGLELGLLEGLRRRVSPATRAFLAQATTRAGIMGVLVGLFAVGRPFPVMREFLTYAAAAGSPLYGAAVMMVQGLGQIAVMVLLFLAVLALAGRRLTGWVATRPQQVALAQAMALLVGGTFFVFYWGLSFALGIGRWGFRLGWYS